MRMKKVLLRTGVWLGAFLLGGILYLALAGFPSRPIVKAQQVKPKVVNQHWKIIPNILPDNLQGECEKLNAQGIMLERHDMFFAEGKWTIFLYDRAAEEEDEGR